MSKLPASVRALWAKVSAAPEQFDVTRVKRAHMLRAILLAVFATHGVLLLIGTPFVFVRKLDGAVLVGIVLLAAAFSWRRMQRGDVALASQVIAWTMWAVYSAMVLLAGSANVGFYIPIIFIAVVLLGPVGAVVIGFSCAAVAALVIFGADLGVELPRYFPAPPATRFLFFLTQTALAIVPFYVIGRNLTSALERAGREITERALAQQELQHSEHRLMLALEAARTGIWEWQISSGKLTATSQAEAVFGLRAGQFGGTYEEYLRLVHPEDVDRVVDFNLGVLDGRTRGRAIEHRVICEDGSIRWIEGRGTLRRDAAGKPMCVIGTVVDVTPRKKAEIALVENERRYHTILDTMIEGVILRGPQREVLLANPAAQRILGVRAEDIHYEALRERGWRTCREDGSPFPESEFPFEVAMRTGQPQFDVVMGIKRPDRSLTWVSINAQPVSEPGATKPYAVVVSHADITARKLSEAALRASEERFSKAFRATPAFITISTLADGRYVDVNEEFSRATGHRRDEVIGRTSLEIDLWADAADRRRMVEVLAREKRVSRMEINLRRKSGEIMNCELSAEVLEFEGVPCMLAVTYDVTERRRAQQMLEQERMLLRTLVDNLPDDIFVLDTAGRFTLVNSTWLAEHRISSVDGVIGKSPMDVFDADMAGRVVAENRRIIETGIGLFNQSRAMPQPDGSTRWILTSKIPMRDGDGQITGIVGIIRDVSELKNALDTLQQERNLLRAIIDTVPDAILVKDRECRYVIMNKQGMSLRGVTAQDEIVGKSAHDFLTEAAARTHEEEDRWVMNSRTPVINVRRQPALQNTGRKWVSSSKVPLVGTDGAVYGMVEVNRDITDLQNIIEQVNSLNAELEDRVRVRTQELQEANKELEAFSYSVSHDLRAPLRSISGFGEFLLKENFEQLDAGGKGRLQRILAASARMARLIDDLLKLSRISRQSIAVRKVDLRALAAGTFAALREESPQRQVEVVIAPELTIEADAGLMRIVLDNLLGNAWKFTGQRADARIELGSAANGGERVYFVRDNGAGFDMTYAGKLFTPFQRMHGQQQFEGTGIGLATVKRIIERHRGRIWIESAVDGGTTVFFTVGEPA